MIANLSSGLFEFMLNYFFQCSWGRTGSILNMFNLTRLSTLTETELHQQQGSRLRMLDWHLQLHYRFGL